MLPAGHVDDDSKRKPGRTAKATLTPRARASVRRMRARCAHLRLTASRRRLRGVRTTRDLPSDAVAFGLPLNELVAAVRPRWEYFSGQRNKHDDERSIRRLGSAADLLPNGPAGGEIGIHPNFGGRLLSLGEVQPKAASSGLFVLSGNGGISVQGVEELDGFRITQRSYSASGHHGRLGKAVSSRSTSRARSACLMQSQNACFVKLAVLCVGMLPASCQQPQKLAPAPRARTL